MVLLVLLSLVAQFTTSLQVGNYSVLWPHLGGTESVNAGFIVVLSCVGSGEFKLNSNVNGEPVDNRAGFLVHSTVPYSEIDCKYLIRYQ